MCSLLLILLGAAVAFPFQVHAIAEGHGSSKTSVPYLVSLNDGKRYCSGSLISHQWVLSAAQCYKPRIKVRLGEHNTKDMEGNEQFINSAKVIPHPKYNSSTLDNDIMVVKLAEPATFSARVQAVALPTQSAEAGTDCLISGWGNTLSSSGNDANILHVMKTLILKHSECQQLYPGELLNHKDCVGDCPGDSGGPVVCNGELQGVVSRTRSARIQGVVSRKRSTQINYPSVFTRVSKYLDWLKDTLDSN